MRLPLGSLLLLTAATTLGAQTNVRGDNAGTNAVAGPAIRTAPKVIWETKVGYRDIGSMAVSGSVLVTGNTSGTGGVFGYDTNSGKLLWKIAGHLRGDVAVDANAAYAVSEGQNYQFRLQKLALRTGAVLWTTQSYDLGHTEAPPLVADGHVFLVSHNDTIASYDAATGAPNWKLKITKRCSPALVYQQGTLYLSGGVDAKRQTLTALDAATGAVRWAVSPTPEYNDCTSAAAISGDLLLLRVANFVVAIDRATGATRWAKPVKQIVDGRTRSPMLTELTVHNGVVYTTMTTALLGFDIATGKPLLDQPMTFASEPNDYRMIAADGVLYFQGNRELPADSASGKGYLYAYDLAKHEFLWNHHEARPDRGDPNGSWSTAYFVLTGGAIYYETAGLLVKLGG